MDENRGPRGKLCLLVSGEPALELAARVAAHPIVESQDLFAGPLSEMKGSGTGGRKLSFCLKWGKISGRALKLLVLDCTEI